MRKIRILFLSILSVIVMTSLATANKDVTVMINGSKLVSDVPPQIINGRTLIPIRAVSENLGAKVEWHESERKVVIWHTLMTGEQTTISLRIDSSSAIVGGSSHWLDQPPLIVNGRTMVPLRFISESMGADVGWNGDTSTVTIEAEEAYRIYPEDKVGTVKGIVTWKNDESSETKSDYRTNIGFIPTNIPENVEKSIFAEYLQPGKPGYHGVYSTTVDQNGRYELNVPAGEYYLLIISRNSKGNGKVESSDEELLRKHFNDEDWSNLVKHLNSREHEIRTIQVSENGTITEDYHFGYTESSDSSSENSSKTALYYENGNIRYKGSISKGVPHGNGEYYREDGSIEYLGSFKYGKKHGFGIGYYENGKTSYMGDYENGLMHGIGTLYRDNGTMAYLGDFENNKAQGKGTVYYENGNRAYSGDFKDNNGNGEGTMYNKDGSILYVGQVRDSEPNGSGILYDKNGNIAYYGYFKNGKPLGW